jgi:hypothetical protein
MTRVYQIHSNEARFEGADVRQQLHSPGPCVSRNAREIMCPMMLGHKDVFHGSQG